jgi:tetraacyldisaccharide 4'-kinase
VDDAGDEASLMAERLKGVPIVKGKDRYEAGMFALRHLDPDFALPGSKVLFVLDDGFQHWKLARDIDIVLIDATDPFGNRKLLPAGRLREPLREMGRADIVVISKKPQQDPERDGLHGPSPMDRLIDEIRDNNPRAPLYVAEHVAAGLNTLSGRDLPADALSGRRVLGFCGLGNPASFRNTLQGLKGLLADDILSFRDHVVYAPRHIRKIRREALRRNVDWIVTTEKDIMKLKELAVPQDLASILVSLRIDFSIDTAFYENVFSAGP